MNKYFIISIDTESDNAWEKSNEIKMDNFLELPRFQKLCESYGFKPTYLVNYEMANSLFFKEFGSEIIKNQTKILQVKKNIFFLTDIYYTRFNKS